MTLAANALQKAIYQRLSAQLTVPVYDFVPQEASLPYVVIGADTSISNDTKTEDGWQFTCAIHAWDKPSAGRKGVKTILEAIYLALHRQEDAIAISGHHLTELRCEYSETFQETAYQGDTDQHYHGVMRFRALVAN